VIGDGGEAALAAMMAAIGLAVYGASRLLQLNGRVSTHGDSRWARRRDLRRLGTEPGVGRVVIGWHGSQLLAAPSEDNLLVFGVQRSGKTSTVVIPTLVEWQGAAVATSTKEELVTLTARHRMMRGPVHVFAPLDQDPSWTAALGLRSVTWNPLAEVTTPGLAAELADVLTTEGKTSRNPHWYISAANLLTG